MAYSAMIHRNTFNKSHIHYSRHCLPEGIEIGSLSINVNKEVMIILSQNPKCTSQQIRLLMGRKQKSMIFHKDLIYTTILWHFH